MDISKIERIDATKEEIKRYSLKNGDVCLLRSSIKPEDIGYPSLFENSQISVVFARFLIRFKWLPRNLPRCRRSG